MNRFVGSFVLVAAMLLYPLVAAAQVNNSGTITSGAANCLGLNACVTLPFNPNNAGATIQITPGSSFTGTINFEAIVDATTPVNYTTIKGVNINSGASVSSTTGNGTWQFATAGLYGLRARATPGLTGSASVWIQSSAGPPGSGGGGGGAATAVQVCAADLTTCAPVSATDGMTVKSNITDEAVGAAVTNPPVGVGAIFETTPATIATGDRTALHTTADQRLLVQDQGIGSSGNVPNENCDQSVVYDANTNGKTQLVALSTGKITRVCGLTVTQSTTSDVTVSFGSGTGSDCGSTYTAKTPAWPIAQNSVAQLNGLSLSNSPIPYFATAASEELCISTNAGVSVQVLLVFSQRLP